MYTKFYGDSLARELELAGRNRFSIMLAFHATDAHNHIVDLNAPTHREHIRRCFFEVSD
jgi:hypothetical protein